VFLNRLSKQKMHQCSDPPTERIGNDGITPMYDLPSETWVHIFDFLEWNEMCKVSTRVNAKLSRSLLVDDHQELFFRHLCLQSMKKDTKQAIDNILDREIGFSFRLISANRWGNSKSAASPAHASMKELRNRLEYQSNQLFNYFPELYSEYSESITQALNYSHSAYITVTKDYIEEDGRNVKTPQVKTGYSFRRRTRFQNGNRFGMVILVIRQSTKFWILSIQSNVNQNVTWDLEEETLSRYL